MGPLVPLLPGLLGAVQVGVCALLQPLGSDALKRVLRCRYNGGEEWGVGHYLFAPGGGSSSGKAKERCQHMNGAAA